MAKIIGFNPRTHTGCDVLSGNQRLKAVKFQSTHPHGVRPQAEFKATTGALFQSTHPHGVRHQLINSKTPIPMFQSTHPHGVRPDPEVRAWLRRQFQSTHPHGVRQGRWGWWGPPGGFNPRTHTGCDKCGSAVPSRQRCFNPRTHTGCDLLAVPAVHVGGGVSIHAPTRGATVYSANV